MSKSTRDQVRLDLCNNLLCCLVVGVPILARDLAEVRALGSQFCATHVSVSHANVHLVDFNLPVKVGGVWISPDDLIHGDQHGVLTVPHSIADKIPEAAARIEADEQRIIDLCRSPEFSTERLKTLYGEIRPGTY
jgi:regulator of RNase E activity RraA